MAPILFPDTDYALAVNPTGCCLLCKYLSCEACGIDPTLTPASIEFTISGTSADGTFTLSLANTTGYCLWANLYVGDVGYPNFALYNNNETAEFILQYIVSESVVYSFASLSDACPSIGEVFTGFPDPSATATITGITYLPKQIPRVLNVTFHSTCSALDRKTVPVTFGVYPIPTLQPGYLGTFNCDDQELTVILGCLEGFYESESGFPLSVLRPDGTSCLNPFLGFVGTLSYSPVMSRYGSAASPLPFYYDDASCCGCSTSDTFWAEITE